MFSLVLFLNGYPVVEWKTKYNSSAAAAVLIAATTSFKNIFES